jgi:beta-N-acetylhexosaminidase
MEQAEPSLFHDQQNNDILSVKAQKLKGIRKVRLTNTLQRESIETDDTVESESIYKDESIEFVDTIKTRQTTLTHGHALILIGLLCIIVLRTINMGSEQFIGPQGWAYVLAGAAGTGNNNLLWTLNQDLRYTRRLTPGSIAEPTLTPQQYINLIMQHMTLDQKLGQMLIVQFDGPTYSLNLSTMISQYNVGAILIYADNGNIVSKEQLKGLTQQMQSDSSLPLAIAIDQEGGTVDRLKSLDGPHPSATAIGTTNDSAKALAAGKQDAKDLSFYGINLNLAPVVDVRRVYNPQLYLRTYGNNAELVTRMAAAYLQGLQQSGKVLGTLKHFPGLGDVAADPHNSVPYLNASRSDLETIDWAPYRALIRQGDVYSILVTHEVVREIDDTRPSTLSYQVVTGILREELGFQGVIMTDSLTMVGVTAYYTLTQAAVLAIEAGSDLLMGASTPQDVATMIAGIHQAINAGNISMQRIDDSVRRILMLKYQMGLIRIPYP